MLQLDLLEVIEMVTAEHKALAVARQHLKSQRLGLWQKRGQKAFILTN